ncbi:MAG: glycogen synthase [Deltaproteobacteria bacterium]|nr:MAG: glycogen synthase [Deltaproteobacteria bacterium]
MRILSISAEMVPWAKTGGLADVAGALPGALEALGHEVRAFVPLYERHVPAGLRLHAEGEPLDVPVGAHRVRVRIVRDPERPWARLVRCPGLFGRASIYGNGPDEHIRFLAFSRAALMAARREGFVADIVHCHDWQAAMVPLDLRVHLRGDPVLGGARTLLTIHNMQYQGRFPAGILPDLGLGAARGLLHQDQLRAGVVNFLLHGILYADGISTVSPTYAREIQEPVHGAGLDPFLRARSSTVVGVLNGIDDAIWSPEADALIPHRYSAADLSGKALNRSALRKAMGLGEQDVPLFGIVSRLAAQKGFDLIPEALGGMLDRGELQLVVLGSGGRLLEQMFRALARAFPRQVAFHHGFSNPLAHLIEAGADAFLMPSRYEPCGLNQLYSLRYGTPPVVYRTGGLADSVEPWHPGRRTGTGFVFEHHDAIGLRWAVGQAIRTWRDPEAWEALVHNGMAKDFSWRRQARIYDTLYTRLRS